MPIFLLGLNHGPNFFCYVCIVYILYVWSWSSAPFVSELCVRRTSDESRHSRAINAMYHSLRSKNRHQDVMSCHRDQKTLKSLSTVLYTSSILALPFLLTHTPLFLSPPDTPPQPSTTLSIRM